MLQVNFNFVNDFQRKFFALTKKNQCASGGYGNGKTSVVCMKGIALATKFPKYRLIIFRRSFVDLKNTTRPTFFKYCPKELYDPKFGGNRADSQGYLRLINGSEVIWLHADNTDSNVIRGLEPNSVIVDQCEEISEEIYSHLDSRVGRWDKAEIPPDLDITRFPKNKATGLPLVPSYMMITVNPDDFSHYVYRWYHPESEDHHEVYYDDYFKEYYARSDTHEMIQAAMTDNPALDPSVIRTAMAKGKDFRRRFVEGKWGITEGRIHELSPLSVIDNCPIEFYREIVKNGTKCRVYDHGLTAPSCCLWFSVYKNWIFCYREYYQENTLITDHRKNITELSQFEDIEEFYTLNLADPAIFKKSAEKYGGFICTADDFADPEMDAPPLYWSPADNNEFLTRTRIDELLTVQDTISHPITNMPGAPKLYFIKGTDKIPHGCKYSINQLRAQRKVKIGEVNGEASYSEERDRLIDHAYDPIRYFVASGLKYNPKRSLRNFNGTFYGALRQVKQDGSFNRVIREDRSTVALF